jgi:mono/diheme cytochrome c family protein
MTNSSNFRSLGRAWAAASVVLACSSLVVLVSAAQIGAADATVWDGVYTRAQVQRGQALYKEQCALCHGDRPGAGGAAGPPLAGDEFVSAFKDKSVADLFEKTIKTMPSDNPGSLKPAQVADILAFMFSENQWPAGQTALGTDLAALKQIKVIAKPSR